MQLIFFPKFEFPFVLGFMLPSLFVWWPIETLHEVQKLAKSGLSYMLNNILDITDGI